MQAWLHKPIPKSTTKEFLKNQHYRKILLTPKLKIVLYYEIYTRSWISEYKKNRRRMKFSQSMSCIKELHFNFSLSLKRDEALLFYCNMINNFLHPVTLPNKKMPASVSVSLV
jgi:hypothetical protein